MRQEGLFPEMVLDEKWLEAIMAPLLPQIWRLIRTPFDDLKDRRSRDNGFRILDEGASAQWLRPQIIELAKTMFEGSDEIRVECKKQQTYLNYKDMLAIVPKKFKVDEANGTLTFSSYNTPQNLDHWGRKEVDGLPMLPRLIAGYQFIEEMTDIKIWVAYPYGKDVSTRILVPDQNGSIVGIHVPPREIDDLEDTPGYTVKPKKKKKDDRERS